MPIARTIASAWRATFDRLLDARAVLRGIAEDDRVAAPVGVVFGDAHAFGVHTLTPAPARAVMPGQHVDAASGIARVAAEVQPLRVRADDGERPDLAAIERQQPALRS